MVRGRQDSTDPPKSQVYALIFATVVEHLVGIRFNTKQRVDIDERCINEGWGKMRGTRRVTARTSRC
jgi:hypothetical protein